MTVQYDGNDNYFIFIGHNSYKLTKSEIDEIQKFDFRTMKICKSNEEFLDDLENLSEKNDELEDNLKKLSEKISDLENEIDWLKDENAELNKQGPE